MNTCPKCNCAWNGQTCVQCGHAKKLPTAKIPAEITYEGFGARVKRARLPRIPPHRHTYLTGPAATTNTAALAGLAELIEREATEPIALIRCGDGTDMLVGPDTVTLIHADGRTSLTQTDGALEYGRRWAERERGGIAFEVKVR